MSGLLLKDALVLRSQLKIYMIIVIFWFVISMWNGSPGFFGGLAIMFVMMVPMTAVAYDDSSSWQSFALTAPVSRSQLVLSKYLLALITLASISLIVLCGSMIIGAGAYESALVTLAVMPFGAVMVSVLLPIIFRFGVEKGRFVFLAFVAFVVAVVVASGGRLASLAEDGGILDSVLSVNAGVLAAAVIALTFAIGAISFLISKKIYDKKEF